MARRRVFTSLFWLLLSGTYAMRPPRRYAKPEARIALVEEAIAREDLEAEGTGGHSYLPSDGCPFMKNITKELQKKHQEQVDEINAAFKDVIELAESCVNCTNATEVRNVILSKLNASVKCDLEPACNAFQPYREVDGSCNNLRHPDWGKTDSCLRRVLSPAYADGVSKPRRACDGSELPSARLVSTTLHEEKNRTHGNLTHLAMIFGQFLTHDITFVSFAPLSHIEFELGTGPFHLCENGEPECIPIDVPKNDTFYSHYNVTSLPILRSLYCPICDNGYRDQMNSRTSYLDLSHVYGINWDIQASMRRFDKGLLISQEVNGAELPQDSPFPHADNCSLPKNKCSWAGDLRATQHIGLLSMQTLWIRQHNRIAKNLSELNPSWDDEKLFQVTRRICEAIYQNIVFGEWLTLMLGEEKMETFQLNPLTENYTEYNESADATVTNEFSAAAFRFGHSQADGRFWRIGKNTEWIEPADLSTGYFVPHNNSEGIHDDVLRGSLKQPMQDSDRYGDNAVTRHLFRQSYLEYGSDLFATDIQRGRDHGLRPYADYVEYCQNVTLTDFESMKQLMAEENVTDIFQKLYKNVTDVDLFSGGLSEKPIQGAQVGQTFACIIAEVFHRLKFGDRFYYEHGNQSGSFTQEQLQSIRNVTLASVYCNNIEGLMCIQRNVFLQEGSSELVACSEIADVDLSLWKDSTDSAIQEK